MGVWKDTKDGQFSWSGAAHLAGKVGDFLLDVLPWYSKIIKPSFQALVELFLEQERKKGRIK